MRKKNLIGHCCLCGELKELTFEHVPPKTAFNGKPIFIQNHDNLVDESSLYFGKGRKSNRGFGGYTLCKDCNSLTGSWYANDFGSFVRQGKSIVEGYERIDGIVSGTYHFKPLNVLKQILTMFMSADKAGHLSSQKELVDFILNKEVVGIPTGFKVFLYSTLSSDMRMFGYSIVLDPKLGIQKWSEINFPPFGYFLAHESEAAHYAMLDISSWGNFKFDQIMTADMTTGYLTVKGPFLGVYGT